MNIIKTTVFLTLVFGGAITIDATSSLKTVDESIKKTMLLPYSNLETETIKFNFDSSNNEAQNTISQEIITLTIEDI